ncbi:MAG TPA: hypothetical protein VK578_19595 [Edaphobacter sp.]|nr:hypothetical protein [Edaphobacter sp.]
MQIQGVTRKDGVKGRYVPGVGATPPSGLPRRLTPRWSLPPPACRLPNQVPDHVQSWYFVRSKAGT